MIMTIKMPQNCCLSDFHELIQLDKANNCLMKQFFVLFKTNSHGQKEPMKTVTTTTINWSNDHFCNLCDQVSNNKNWLICCHKHQVATSCRQMAPIGAQKLLLYYIILQRKFSEWQLEKTSSF